MFTAKWRQQMVRLHLEGNNPSIEGMLFEKPGDFYRLLKPELISAENSNVSMDGEVWVPRDRVLFCQVLAVDGNPGKSR